MRSESRDSRLVYYEASSRGYEISNLVNVVYEDTSGKFACFFELPKRRLQRSQSDVLREVASEIIAMRAQAMEKTITPIPWLL